jgi:Xaa-Pro dipeptidase
VEDVRAVKSAAELALIRKAARLTDAAAAAGLAVIREGVLDYEITAAVAASLITSASEAFAIFPNIAVGYRSGMPHNSSAGVVAKRGDTVFIECSPALHWYNAPLMRTAVIGAPSDPFVEDVAEVGTAALDAMCAAMRPGATSGDVAEAGSIALRRIRSKVLFHEYFGYSVGIGFPPTWIEGGISNLIVGNTFPLVSGMAFHLPMTLRVMGKFGVGQSRTVIVSDNGAEVLTEFPPGLHRIS